MAFFGASLTRRELLARIFRRRFEGEPVRTASIRTATSDVPAIRPAPQAVPRGDAELIERPDTAVADRGDRS